MLLKILAVIAVLVPQFSLATEYGTDFLSGLTATCDSFESGGGGFPCSNINDGNTATRWISENNTNQHYVKFDTNASTSPAKVRFNLVKDGSFTGLQSFSVFVSHDDSSYQQLVASTTVTTASQNEWQDFVWTPSSTAYEWVKVIGYAENNGGLEHEITLWEIQMMEEEPTPTSSNGFIAVDTSSDPTGIIVVGFLIIGLLIWIFRH